VLKLPSQAVVTGGWMSCRDVVDGNPNVDKTKVFAGSCTSHRRKAKAARQHRSSDVSQTIIVSGLTRTTDHRRPFKVLVTLKDDQRVLMRKPPRGARGQGIKPVAAAGPAAGVLTLRARTFTHELRSESPEDLPQVRTSRRGPRRGDRLDALASALLLAVSINDADRP